MAYRWLEQPIDPFLGLADTTRLNLPEASKEPLRQAICCLVANAILAAMKDVPAVHYSRDHTFYAQPTSSIPTWCSRRNVVGALELLVDAGLLVSMPTKPGSNNRHRSSFSATALLGERAASMTVDDLVQLDRPPVELRDRDTDVVIHPSQWAVADRQTLHKIGQDVQAQNVLLRGTRIELTGKYPRTGHGLIAVQHRFINPRKCTLQRVFRANLNLGGRWYGGWWQNLPKSARAHLLINGEPAVEVDYSACQLRLTYASVGQPDPLAGEVDQRDVKIDLYAGIGMDRDVAKQAFLIMINARHQQSAEFALAKWFRDNDRFLNEDKPLELAKRATRVVASHFAVLKSAFFSDLGLKLQRLDADICAEVQREFRARGIAVLSVHDSFIVARRHEEELRAVMSAAFKRGMLSVRDMLVHSPA